MTTHIKHLFLITAVALVTACGGGGGGGGGDDDSATEVSSGVITGFGSVLINGIRYHTDSALVTGDGALLGDVTDLKVGMRATVVSDSSSKIASSVSFEEDVKGPLDAGLANFDSQFSVMGQRVVADGATVVDNSVVLPLAAGDILEISGLRQADDSILATFIEQKQFGDIDKYEVIGQARGVGPTSFMIDQLTVDYSGADMSDFNGAGISEGQLVEVKNENRVYTPGSNSLIATKVEPFSFLGGAGSSAGAIIQIESVVTAVTNPGAQFTIPGFTVNIQAGTGFRYGTADQITAGTVLTIKATRNGDVLNATRITFKRNSTRMEAAVDSVNGGNQLTLLGITVQLTGDTEMEDNRDDVSPFDISDIAPNDYLEIRGFTGAGGVFVATELRREDFQNRAELRGVATNIVSGVSVDILGVTATAGGSTQFRISTGSGSDTPTNSSKFFSMLTEGLTIVEVRWGSANSTAGNVQEMELEEVF